MSIGGIQRIPGSQEVCGSLSSNRSTAIDPDGVIDGTRITRLSVLPLLLKETTLMAESLHSSDEDVLCN